MALPFKSPVYILVVAILGIIMTFSYILNVRSKNASLSRDLTFYQEALAVCKEKNKLLVKDSKTRQNAQDARIKELDEQIMQKHTDLGTLNNKFQLLKRQVTQKSEDIKELQRSAFNHKEEISVLKDSILQTQGAFKKLLEKTDHLMSNHTKLKQEKHGLLVQNENLESEVKQHRYHRENIGERMRQLIKKNEMLERTVDELSNKNKFMQDGIQKTIKESYVPHDISVSQHQPVSTEHQDDIPVKKLVSQKYGMVTEELVQPMSSVVADTGKSLSQTPQQGTADNIIEKRFSKNQPDKQIDVGTGNHNRSEDREQSVAEGRKQSAIPDGVDQTNIV